MTMQSRVTRALRVLSFVAVVATAAPAQALTQPAPAAQDEFVPVKDIPAEEQLPAAPLLIGAYAIAWVAVLGYVWSLWSRLGRVERELRQLKDRGGEGRG
jgi:CcmD family protein